MDGQTDQQTTKRKVAHDLQSHRHMHQFNNLFFKYKVCKKKLRSGLSVSTVTVHLVITSHPQPPYPRLWACFCKCHAHFCLATWSLAMFLRSHSSLSSLSPQHSTMLRSLHSMMFAHFTGSLVSSTHSLMGRSNFTNMCTCCKCNQRE